MGVIGNDEGFVRHRSAGGCLCCGGTDLHRQTTLVSPFVASQAWGSGPELTEIVGCRACGFRFYDRGLSDEEVARYYANYRDDNYCRRRHSYEPFYTRRVHRNLDEWVFNSARLQPIRESLHKAGAPRSFATALDYGGGCGQIVSGMEAGDKAVYDVSHTTPLPGVRAIGKRGAIGNDWQLVLSCQVLEHLSDPRKELERIVAAIGPGGWLYLETPDELWGWRHVHSGATRDALLRAALRLPLLLKLGDCYSTAFRIKTKELPPLGFIPMREHLNYFTVDAMTSLLRGFDLQTRWAGVDSIANFVVVAQKP